MASPRWRVQCRRNGVVFRETSGPGSAGEGTVGRALFDRYAAEFFETTDTNVELQERETGRARYRPIYQAVGKRVLRW